MTRELGEHSNLTSIEIEIVTEKAVRKTFLALGVDLSDPKSVQYMQRDFAYMRRQRVGGEKVADGIRNSVIVVIVGGFLWALWQGFRAVLSAKGVP